MMTYRDDEQAQNYKRIADLEEENRNLRSQAPKRSWKFPEIDMERLFAWTGWVVVVLLIGAIAFLFGKLVTRTGQVEHCYIKEVSCYNTAPIYELVGYRSFAEDIDISRHDSVVNAWKAAEMLKCPLLKK